MTRDPIARERIAALDRRLTEAVAAQDRANTIALQAAEKAVLKAETASEKRFEGVNEFRQTLSDQAANFVTRKEVEALFAAVNGTLLRLDTSASADHGKSAGADYAWRAIITVIGLLIAASGFLLAVTKGGM